MCQRLLRKCFEMSPSPSTWLSYLLDHSPMWVFEDCIRCSKPNVLSLAYAEEYWWWSCLCLSPKSLYLRQNHLIQPTCHLEKWIYPLQCRCVPWKWRLLDCYLHADPKPWRLNHMRRLLWGLSTHHKRYLISEPCGPAAHWLIACWDSRHTLSHPPCLRTGAHQNCRIQYCTHLKNGKKGSEWMVLIVYNKVNM